MQLSSVVTRGRDVIDAVLGGCSTTDRDTLGGSVAEFLAPIAAGAAESATPVLGAAAAAALDIPPDNPLVELLASAFSGARASDVAAEGGWQRATSRPLQHLGTPRADILAGRSGSRFDVFNEEMPSCEAFNSESNSLEGVVHSEGQFRIA
ncbi:hypothetical protein EON66_07030 [archaeon]|nr:MAG: hypothetical protein EON66_07030 [archaeon]